MDENMDYDENDNDDKIDWGDNRDKDINCEDNYDTVKDFPEV